MENFNIFKFRYLLMVTALLPLVVLQVLAPAHDTTVPVPLSQLIEQYGGILETKQPSGVVIQGTLCKIDYQDNHTILYLKTNDDEKIPVILEKQLPNNNNLKVGMKVEIQALFVNAPQGQKTINGEII